MLDRSPREGAVKKLVVFVGALVAMTACAESSTAPSTQRTVPQAAHRDVTCRSGYVIAYDSNGNPYCAPADSSGTQQQAAMRLP